MASKRKQGALLCEEVNERRRIKRYNRPKRDQVKENYANAKGNEKKRLERKVDVKLEKERGKFRIEKKMDERVKNCPLVQAMKEGFLNEFKRFREENSSFLIDILMDQCDLYVALFVEGLEEFDKSKSGLDTMGIYYAKAYFEGKHN